MSAPIPTVAVKPDGAEYIVRLVSVKPVQAAARRLLGLHGKLFGHFQPGPSDHHLSTNAAEAWYNPDDMITVALILKRPGPDGASFLDYAFNNKTSFPAPEIRMWPCAALRTQNGQVFDRLGGLDGIWGYTPQGDIIPAGIIMSFPHLIDDKPNQPLISRSDEKVEFRCILHQRVFETTFVVNAADLNDGSERVLRNTIFSDLLGEIAPK